MGSSDVHAGGGAFFFLCVNDALLTGSAVNILGRFDSVILLVFFAGFLIYIYRTMRTAADIDEGDPIKIYSTLFRLEW
ncbi:MAG: hypothetical protein WDN75_21500 [Bacteroidota bacterium]